MSSPLTVLCLSSAHKGVAILREYKRLGCRVLLVIPERCKDDDWPMEAIDERFIMPDLLDINNIVNAVSYLARSEHIGIIQPLDDYELDTSATLREHLRLPGLGESATRLWRDKLAMRTRARERGIPVPEFSPVLNYDDLRAFMARVPAPWLLKPRGEAGAMGIKKVHSPDEVWTWLQQFGDMQSKFLLEQFVPSDVFHVDSIVWERQVKFNIASGYGQPPLSVSHGGGVFTTRVQDRNSPLAQNLFAMNARVIEAFGLERGITHIEFLRSQTDGQIRFLEGAARVGGANISDMIEHATGINPWEQWAQIEVARARGEDYRLPTIRADAAAVIICLAKQEWPDLGGYADPEVAWKLNKQYHAGLILRSPDFARVQTLLDDYTTRFQTDFVNWLPPIDTGRG